MAGQTPRGNGTRATASHSVPLPAALPQASPPAAPGLDALIREQLRLHQAGAAAAPKAPAARSAAQCAASLQRFTLNRPGTLAEAHEAEESSRVATPPANDTLSAIDDASTELHAVGSHLRLMAALCPATPGAQLATSGATFSEHLHDLARRAHAASQCVETLPRPAYAVDQHDAASEHTSRLAAALRSLADATGLRPAGCLDLAADDVATALADLGRIAHRAVDCLDALARRQAHGARAA